MSIHVLIAKIKRHIPIDISNIMVSIVIILVGVSSFFIGRISAENSGSGSVSIIGAQSGNFISTPSSPSTEKIKSGEYIASKNGKLYYRPDCGGGKRITEANKITFASALLAENAGYKPSPSCAP